MVFLLYTFKTKLKGSNPNTEVFQSNYRPMTVVIISSFQIFDRKSFTNIIQLQYP